jgi:hypothetical protein
MEYRGQPSMSAGAQAPAPDDGLIIVGNSGGTNVGASLYRAALNAGLRAVLLDATAAYRAPRMTARFNWWVRGRRPTHLDEFSAQVVEACATLRPRWLVATGLAPLRRSALDRVADLGVETINYLTDDPWNRAFRSRWFFDALPAYARVFSPRHANLHELAEQGCRRVEYLPFAVDPELFFPDPPPFEERTRYEADVFFAGGADRDRAPVLGAFVDAGLKVALYGSYWERFRQTRRVSRGQAPAAELRRAAGTAAVSLCLVRRANRDDHSMRSFEIPAAGGCMLAEDTRDHRALFGDEGHAVLYFRDVHEAVDKTRWLVSHPERREELVKNALRIVTGGRHTYADRLQSILAPV